MSRKNKTNDTGETKDFAQIFSQWFKDEENRKKISKTTKYILAVLIILGIGFFIGRKTVDQIVKTEIVYLPGEKVEVEVEKPVPVYVKPPIDSANVIAECVKSGKFSDLFPTKVKDSIIYVSKEDSSAVIKDWATERVYEQKLFEIDTVGVATVRAKTQYNRITWMSGTFVPVIKQTTVTNVVTKKYSPFVGGGITTMPEAVLNAGVYFDDKYGVSVMYEYNWELKKRAVGLMATWKF